MGLSDEERNSVVQFRMEKANKTFAEIDNLKKLGYWQTAANRLYYACYYAVSALLIQNGIVAQTHSGVINQFGLHFIRKGLLSAENGKFYKRLFELRQTGDYSDWIDVDEEDLTPLIPKAQKFIETIEKLILDI